jgi:hypothetical protein
MDARLCDRQELMLTLTLRFFGHPRRMPSE